MFSAGVHFAFLAAILFLIASPPPHASIAEAPVVVEVVTPQEIERARAEPEKAEAALPVPEMAPSTPPSRESPPPAAEPPQPPAAPPPAPEPPPRASTFDEVAAQLRYQPALRAPPPELRPTDSSAANEQIAAFKSRLKTCWRLEAGVPANSRAHVVIRVTLRTDGRLAAQPSLIEASASADGAAVMRAAMKAVAACAPFPLPREHYNQWRLMDVRVSPAEMGGSG